MSANKHMKHICKNCWYYIGKGTDNGKCINCEFPSDIRKKKPNDICDGGGLGADDFGFRPCER